MVCRGEVLLIRACILLSPHPPPTWLFRICFILGCSVFALFVAAALVQKAPDVPGEIQIDLCWPHTGIFFIKKNPPLTTTFICISHPSHDAILGGGWGGGGGGPPEEYKFHPYRTTKEMKLPKFSLNPIQALIYIRIAHFHRAGLNVRTKTHNKKKPF